MSSWTIRGTGAQAFTAATPADLLREMAEFADVWTENDTSGVQFVSDVSIRFGGESSTPWEGVVYTDSIKASLSETAAYPGQAELSYETGFEASGQVVNIANVNVYLGEGSDS